MAKNRKVAIVDGLMPGSPTLPTAVQIGDVFFASGITGRDPATGVLKASPEEQFAQAYENLSRALDQLGATPDQVGLVTNLLGDQYDYRSLQNGPWVPLFPDEASRPGRKTTRLPLPEGEALEVQAIGVTTGKRESIYVPGIEHRAPLPNGSKIGNYVFSSILNSSSREDRSTSPDGFAQVDQMFDNMRAFMKEAGGSPDDVIWGWNYLNDYKFRNYLHETYLKQWPDEKSRPSRNNQRYELRDGAQVEGQIIAVLNGKRTSPGVPGLAHHDPIPISARINDMIVSSGFFGQDPQGPNPSEMMEGIAAQMEHALVNADVLMKGIGGTLADVVNVNLLVQDYADLAAIDEVWWDVFKTPEASPARQVMKLGLSGNHLLQAHITAIT